MQTDASNVTLPNLFANKFFRIPNYQRGYAWGETQLNDLWEDISDIKKVDGNYRLHFTGVITLRKKEKNELLDAENKLLSEGMEFFDVVDGQQRLTTITILLFELIKQLKSGKNELIKTYIRHTSKSRTVYRFSYGSDSPNNNNYLLSEIFEDNALPSKENVYTKNLTRAKTFFADKISQLQPRQIKELKEKILTALVFDTKYIANNLEVQAVFETMNNRGKPLTTLEKLKNRLIYLTSKLDPSNDISGLTQTINDSWGIIYEKLGSNPDHLLNEDEFLSAFLTLIRVPADDPFSESASETKVFQMFCNHASKYDLSMARQHDASIKEPEVDFDKINDFVIDIANFAPCWYNVCLPDTKTPQGLNIFKIQLLNGSKMMRIFLAQLLSLSNKFPNEIEECIDKVLKVVFRNSLPGVSVMDERTLANRARELHSGTLAVQELNEELDTKLKDLIPTQTIINSFRYLFTYVRGGKGFYRWNALKYFLMEYEKDLQGKGLDHVKWEEFNRTSIEHVLPQRWQDHWSSEINMYRSNKANVLTPEEYDRAPSILINTLGNLTIIQDIKNPGVGNRPWSQKKAAYVNGCYSESEISTEINWDSTSILDRGIRMLDFLCRFLTYNNVSPLKLINNGTQNDYVDILLVDKKYT